MATPEYNFNSLQFPSILRRLRFLATTPEEQALVRKAAQDYHRLSLEIYALEAQVADLDTELSQDGRPQPQEDDDPNPDQVILLVNERLDAHRQILNKQTTNIL